MINQRTKLLSILNMCNAILLNKKDTDFGFQKLKKYARNF